MKSSRWEVLLTIILLLAVPVVLFFYVRDSHAHVPLPHVPMQIEATQCPVALDYPHVVGCYFERPFGTHRIYWNGEPQVLWHEIGHVFDATEMQPPDRDKFKRIFGLEVLGWHEDILQDNTAPAEYFADAYARCMTHTRVNVLVRPWQHRASCRIVWNADRERNP